MIPNDDDIPIIEDSDIQSKKLELNLISKFSGTDKQNTSISPDERLLLSLIWDNLVTNRYPISKQFCKDNNIKYNETEFYNDSVKSFLLNYIEFGLPVNREGRKETVRILQSYFNREIENNQKPEKLIS